MENTGRKTVKGRTTSAPLVAKSAKSAKSTADKTKDKIANETTAQSDTPAAPTPAMAASPVGAEGAVKRVATPEEIAIRSYELFLARGGEHGRDLEDWAQAERELGL